MRAVLITAALRFRQQGFQMIDVAVNVTVREQPDEVEALPLTARVGDQDVARPVPQRGFRRQWPC